MSDARVSPVNRAGVLTAFAKLLAPRPVVYVFHDLPGWQYAASEMPETYQVILGVSEELWHHVTQSIYELTLRRVEDSVEVRLVYKGKSMRLPLAPSPFEMVLTPDNAMRPLVTELIIEPKPIGAALARPETPT